MFPQDNEINEAFISRKQDNKHLEVMAHKYESLLASIHVKSV